MRLYPEQTCKAAKQSEQAMWVGSCLGQALWLDQKSPRPPQKGGKAGA